MRERTRGSAITTALYVRGQLSYAYTARGYEGEEGSSGWKPPSLRGARGRRETSRRNGRENARGNHGGHHGTYQKNGGGTSSNLGPATAYDGTRSRGRRDFRDFRGDATPGSALLEAFKKNAKSREIPSLSLADVAGHVCEFARDQHGSRFIQQRLENAASDEIAAALAEMLPEAVDLASDVFGNYVAQKFFECGDSAARATLSARLEGHVLKLSLHAYGCRVVQKALETVDEDTKAKLAAELDGNVLRCVRDQNGNHVVQKCVERMETRRLGFIVSALAGHVASLSAHPYGCRVIQRALERCAPYCPSLDADGNVTNANETNEAEASEKTSEKIPSCDSPLWRFCAPPARSRATGTGTTWCSTCFSTGTTHRANPCSRRWRGRSYRSRSTSSPVTSSRSVSPTAAPRSARS